MIKLLASVTTSQEALWALEAGVDIIDLKNPSEGALGALSIVLIREIVETVDGRATVSATIGDLPMQPELIVEAITETAAAGVDMVKVGFFPSADHLACIHAIKPLINRGIKIVSVLFADQQPDFGLLPALASAGFFGAMLDTAHKNGSSLMDNQPIGNLNDFVCKAKAVGLESGLAGSLKLKDVPDLLLLNPGYLGFRGALCSGYNRVSALDKSKIFELKNMLRKNNTSLNSLAYS
ncbi:MAG TPA: (5-formylfuran-3-yl)methyl phosphate synthase [Methylophilaceae bacterium]|nr:(5-formylfuran-3-yl)methyl phosphate synthase [Methylophilaceae bacterium]